MKNKKKNQPRIKNERKKEIKKKNGNKNVYAFYIYNTEFQTIYELKKKKK